MPMDVFRSFWSYKKKGGLAGDKPRLVLDDTIIEIYKTWAQRALAEQDGIALAELMSFNYS